MTRATVAAVVAAAAFVVACAPAGETAAVSGDAAPAETSAAPTTVLAPPETQRNRFLSKITHHQLLAWTDEELLAAGHAVCDRLDAGQDGLSWIMDTYGVSTEAAADLHVIATKTLGCAQ